MTGKEDEGMRVISCGPPSRLLYCDTSGSCVQINCLFQKLQEEKTLNAQHKEMIGIGSEETSSLISSPCIVCMSTKDIQIHSFWPFFNFWVLFLCLFLVFQDRFSLFSFGACPGTHSVDQAGLKLTEICLPLPPECWN